MPDQRSPSEHWNAVAQRDPIRDLHAAIDRDAFPLREPIVLSPSQYVSALVGLFWMRSRAGSYHERSTAVGILGHEMRRWGRGRRSGPPSPEEIFGRVSVSEERWRV